MGEFQADPQNRDKVNDITIRGNPYASPYNNSFVSYLKESLRQELEDAHLLNPSAAVEISGVLIRNEINAAGFSTASATIEARFIVKHSGTVRFDKIKTVTDQWDSSLVCAIAIPRAQQKYPSVVQKLLAALYADSDFAAAIKD